MRKNFKLIKNQIFILLIVFILLFGANFGFTQKHFYMKEKEIYQKFKAANKNFLKGKELFLKGDYNKAQKELEKCVDKMTEHVEAHFYLSQILYKKGYFHRALEHIEKAKANFEFMADLQIYAYQQYIEQLKRQKEELGMNLLNLKEQLHQTTNPDTKRALENQITQVQQKIGVIKNRISEPLPSEESIPANYFYFHGNIFFKLKKYQEAHTQYLEAIKINPKHEKAYNNLATLYYMAKQYQKALEYLNQAEANGVEINPE